MPAAAQFEPEHHQPALAASLVFVRSQTSLLAERKSLFDQKKSLFAFLGNSPISA
jgi:hypothetical protein